MSPTSPRFTREVSETEHGASIQANWDRQLGSPIDLAYLDTIGLDGNEAMVHLSLMKLVKGNCQIPTSARLKSLCQDVLALACVSVLVEVDLVSWD